MFKLLIITQSHSVVVEFNTKVEAEIAFDNLYAQSRIVVVVRLY
jgi:hypothetical protein